MKRNCLTMLLLLLLLCIFGPAPTAWASERALLRPRGDQITWIGDSYTQVSERGYGLISARLPGVDVRCQSGKNFFVDLPADSGGHSGITILREILENGEPVRQYVVFALGANNRELDAQGVNYIDVLMELLGPERTVILVKPRTFDNTFRTVNRQIDDAARRYANIVVADWAAAVQGKTRSYFVPERDTLHPTLAGYQLWVDTIVDALPLREPPRVMVLRYAQLLPGERVAERL